MRKLLSALFIGLLSSVSHGQTDKVRTPNASGQEKSQLAQTPSTEIEEANKLNASVLQLYTAEKYKEALPLAQRVLTLREKALKDDDPLIGSALNNLALIYISLGDVVKAEPLFERILVRREMGQSPTSAATLSVFAAYRCVVSVRGMGKDDKRPNLSQRIGKVMLQDAIVAAGLTPPANLDEVGGKPTKHPQPRYPAEAKSERIQGTVLILLDIDETGRVVRAEPVPCWSRQKSLADASAEAARQAQFTPVLINGQPIKWKLLRSYSFVLQ